MSTGIRVIVLGIILLIVPLLAHSMSVDVDGDGKVGPQEVFDLLLGWNGPAVPLGDVQLWQANGSSIYYNNGNVGIGSAESIFPLTIQTPAGFGWVHTDGVHEVGSFVNSKGGWLGTRSNHALHLYTNNSAPQVTLTPSGALGIGTTEPNPATQLNVITNVADHQAVRGDAPNGNGVVGTNAREGYAATGGVNYAGDSGVGVYGEANSGLLGRGVWGQANGGIGVYGTCNSAQGTDSSGVLGRNAANNGNGVIGEASNGTGSYGVWGRAGGTGVRGEGSVYGVSGEANGFGGVGVIGIQGPGSYAGRFEGTVLVTHDLIVDGSVNKNGSSTTYIDHPLDPANKYLTHSSVESSEFKNVYDGIVVTDGNGYAEITLPNWFESFNRDFRYQLTVIDNTDNNLFVLTKVVKEIEGNFFAVRSSQPNVKVSWQVTGVRKDAYAKAHPIEIEKVKSDKEHGKYLAPELYGKPIEMGIDFRPEIEPVFEPASMADDKDSKP
jgi:hypothetical protein